MADATLHSDVFKFVALRPPEPLKKDDEQTHFVRDARPATETPAGALVRQLQAEGPQRMPELIADFIKRHGYDLEFPQSQGDTQLDRIDDAVRALLPDDVTTRKVAAAVEHVTGGPAKAFYNAAKTQQQLHALWDNYYAFFLLGLTAPQNLGTLTRNLQTFHLLELLAADFRIDGARVLQDVLAAKPVVPAQIADVPRPKVDIQAPKPDVLSDAKVREYKALWSELVDTHRALEEVRSLRFSSKSNTETQDVEVPNHDTGRATTTKLTRITTGLHLDPAHFDALAPQTRSMLRGFQMNETNLRVPDAVSALTSRLEKTNNTIATVADPRVLSYVPPEAMQIRGVSSLISRYDKIFVDPQFPFPVLGNVRKSIKPLGVGDLKVVKQKLKKYVAGEVAHIENVLRGEYKERKHRVLDRTEETLTISTETDEETTKDTQTTERFELKKESEKTVQEQMSVQAGVTVSGSYGMVTFGAHGDFAYSTSTQDSSKSSSNYAREVIDRSVSRIQKKTKEERVTKKLHEVEEINTHGIDNKDKADHVTGIYRWVDKYYDAQIYNYGKRLMFEFIIPEPAAFIEYAQTHQPKKNLVPPVPFPATVTHKDITEWNYQTYIRDYQVQGCTPPPPEFKVISMVMASEAKIDNGVSLSKSSKDLVVPEGYLSVDWAASVSLIFENNPQVKISVANDLLWFTVTDNDARRRDDFQNGSISKYDSIVPVAINCYDINSFFVTVSVNCQRRDDKYESWQITTFEKIMAAYQAQLATYEQKAAALEVQQGVVIHGQNPLINREIEKTELKKHCVKLLMDTYTFGSFDAMKQEKDEVPDFDIFDAVVEGPTIQFLEQAFEWENITYLFYPYFWGRLNQWIHKVNTYDTDPLFSRFLQAGAARVVIPVHPGYNDAIMYYLEHNGAIWKGGTDTPRLNDPLFLSLADELRDQTDDLGNAVAEGDPWEVVLPTTLVYLQQDSILPTFE